MPNHVINEVIFPNTSSAMQIAIKRLCLNAEGELDFAVLLPPPLNSWRGGVSSLHEKAFPYNDLDWCSKNWSTKWGPYHGPTLVCESDSVTLTFQTAWGPPFGWLLAVFNTLNIPFTSQFLSEGEDSSKVCTWTATPMNFTQVEAPEAIHRHLHLLLWGCEEFPEDDEATA